MSKGSKVQGFSDRSQAIELTAQLSFLEEVLMSLHTPLCDLLNIKYPIIQAGMGWDKEGLTTPPALVAAVRKSMSFIM